MVLDPEFVRDIESRIAYTLNLYKASEVSLRVGQIWRCKNPSDFLCGFFTGQMMSIILGSFQLAYRREPESEEHMEIIDLIENHAVEIRELFATFD